MDYKELIDDIRRIANTCYADYNNTGYPNSDKLQNAADAIEALQAELTTEHMNCLMLEGSLKTLQAQVNKLSSWAGGGIEVSLDAWKALQARVNELGDSLAELEITKDGAYAERNRLVSLLSKVFPSGKKKTAIEGWSEDWHGCVYIDLPTGQASWHYHDSQEALFDHLPLYQGTWDGHTTDEKYERIQAIAAGAQAQPLTNGEIYTAYIEATNQTLRPQDERLALLFARAIEKAHKIGGSV